jgi:hypothetical protein
LFRVPKRWLDDLMGMRERSKDAHRVKQRVHELQTNDPRVRHRSPSPARVARFEEVAKEAAQRAWEITARERIAELPASGARDGAGFYPAFFRKVICAP